MVIGKHNGVMALQGGSTVEWSEEEVARRFRAMSPERRMDGNAVAEMVTDYYLQVMTAAGAREVEAEA